jgi:hypothetical protein
LEQTKGKREYSQEGNEALFAALSGRKRAVKRAQDSYGTEPLPYGDEKFSHLAAGYG